MLNKIIMSNITKETWIQYGSLMRILSLITLSMPKIPLPYKIGFVIVGDTFDCGLLFKIIVPILNRIFPRIKIENNVCKTTLYQNNDKVMDIIIYIVTILYLSTSGQGGIYVYPMIGALLWRMYGINKFIKSNDVNNLIFYPDVVRETLIYCVIARKLKIDDRYAIPILLVIWLIKIEYEKYHHGKYKNDNRYREDERE